MLGLRCPLRTFPARRSSNLCIPQLLALRLAVIKCHARGAVDARALRLAADGRQRVRLSCTSEWAASHPRTLYLLQEEAQAWERSGVLKLVLDTDWQ